MRPSGYTSWGRLESGAVLVRKDWHSLEEIVGTALARLERQLDDRPVTTRLPAGLPLVPLDGVLIEQVVINRSRQAARGGVGLGLTVCRGSIEAHGGRVWGENRAGGGVAFRFTLPLGGEPPEILGDDG